MKKTFILHALLVWNIAYSQSTILTPGNANITSTTDGVLVPRMNTGQRTLITGAQGLLVFDITTNSFWYHDGSIWKEINSASQWATNGNKIYNTNNGNVGIGNTNPPFPLSFNGSLGDKISLWTDGTSTHYGFGIQSGLLQIFSKTSVDDIAFGFGSSNSFTEHMRVKGSGFVGIGTNNPNAPLGFPAYLGKKITLYPGATGDVGFAVAGNRLQIYADNPNADVAFGYDAAGVFNERFAVKPTGALAVNLSTGSPGQVITSNGGASSATWGSSTALLYNNTYEFNQTSYLLTTGNGVYYDLPGLNQDITFSSNVKVLLFIQSTGYNNGCFGCGEAIGQLELYVNNAGNPTVYDVVKVGNGTSYIVNSGPRVITLGAGTHNFKMKFKHNGGGDINVYDGITDAFGTRMTIIVIPQ